MLGAIMEFTSAGNMPSVFKDNAGPDVEAATVLPARMDNNQLHRYSKVNSMPKFTYLTNFLLLRILPY